jgi:hypothetical protein
MYIIVQHDYLGRFDLVDAMINEDGSALQTFKTEEDARKFLYRHGLEDFEDGYPHQIRVCRLH